MPPSPDCASLRLLLQQEQVYASRLLDVLKTEHESLAQRDTDALQQSVADKQELLAQLESSHGRRLQLMRDTGLDAGRGGFDALLSLCADCGHDFHSTWTELKDVLASCQRQNQVNGAVLESSRRTTHRALSVLLGGQADSPELYNQSGKSTPSALGGNRVRKA